MRTGIPSGWSDGLPDMGYPFERTMGNAITVRGNLADPRHIELDESVTAFAGAVEVVLRAVGHSPCARKQSGVDRVVLARALQRSAPAQTTDSTDLLRDDRLR